MKLIIASDLHGSLKYTQKLEELIISENPDKIILLGDLLYHGPRNALPEEYATMPVAEILNKYTAKIIAVRGNCDAEVDDMVTDFSLTKDYETINLDGHLFYLTHGHLFEKYKNLIGDNYCLCGHTHIYNLEGKILNPGSVGIPKFHPEHTCFIYENKTVSLVDLDTKQIIQEKTI